MLNWKIKGYRPVKEKYIEQTHAFYLKQGQKIIIMARLVPIVRTFAPFFTGIGKMDYSKFFKYNVIGCSVWVVGLTLMGYFFGNTPLVKNNFEKVIFLIIGISLLPMLFESVKHQLTKNK